MSTTAPAVPSVPATPAAGRRGAALAVLVSAQFVVMLDTSLVNVALPSIQRDLALTPSGLAWVVNAYVVVFGGLLLLSGRAADLLGRRRVLMAGAAVFAAGAVTAGAAVDEVMLVAGRVVQGVGAAALSPAALALLLQAFPGTRRAHAMSAWGAASTAGGASGVLVGGVLTGTVGWSWAFFATVPVCLVVLAAAPRLLDRAAPGPRRRFDAWGAATVTGALAALVHAALAVPTHGWDAPPVITGAVLALGLLATFVVVERRAADPLVPLGLLGDRDVAAGIVLGVLGGAARASSFVLVALCLQQHLHLSPQTAGLAMVPTSLAGFAVSLALLPRVLRALGPERSIVVGLVVLAGGHLWLARVPADAHYVLDVLPGLLLVAAGVALSFTPTTMVIASGVPAQQAGLASGLSSSSAQVGAALGIAAFTAVAAASSHGDAGDGLTGAGFGAAFVAAAAVALVAAAVGAWLARRR